MNMKNKYTKPVVTVENMTTEFSVLAGSDSDLKRDVTTFDLRFSDIDEVQLPTEADGNSHKLDFWDNE